MYYLAIYDCLFFLLEITIIGNCSAHVLCACAPMEPLEIYLEACGSHDLDIYHPYYYDPLHRPRE